MIESLCLYLLCLSAALLCYTGFQNYSLIRSTSCSCSTCCFGLGFQLQNLRGFIKISRALIKGILLGRLFKHARCVVPEGIAYSVILAWHQEVMHNGAASVIQDLQRHFIIPGLTHKCAKVAKHCPVCQATQPLNQRRRGHLEPHPVPDRVMSSVCLDLFELSPVVDDEGTTWDGVLLYTDRLSRYMIGKPICFKGLTGEKAAKILLDARESFFDVPTELTTDRDPKFLSAWFSTICAGLGIHVAYSQAYRHQENGRTEVANKNVLNTLRKMRASVGDTVQGESWFAALRATIRNHNQRVDPELGLSLKRYPEPHGQVTAYNRSPVH